MIYYIIGTFIMSLLTFLIYGFDKHRAIKNKHRISEKTLLVLAFLLGAMGAILGMVVFKHKTTRLKFKVFNHIFVIMHIALGVYIHTRAL